MPYVPDLEKLRLLVGTREDPRRVCKLVLTANDASIYVIPYAANRRFYCGGRTLGEMQTEDTFDFTAGTAADQEPSCLSMSPGRYTSSLPGCVFPSYRFPVWRAFAGSTSRRFSRTASGDCLGTERPSVRKVESKTTSFPQIRESKLGDSPSTSTESARGSPSIGPESL